MVGVDRMDYASRIARALLGVTAHPGGIALSRYVLDVLDLPIGSLVADVACGRGATLDLMADRGLLGIGVDLRAQHPRSVRGDAQALPMRTAAYDGAVVECSVSTFADPERALAELRRVLRPGGRWVLTDIVLRRDLAGPKVVAAVDRLTTARSLAGYVALAEAAGLAVTTQQDRHADALALARRLRHRLPWSADVRACETAVRDRTLGYALLAGAA